MLIKFILDKHNDGVLFRQNKRQLSLHQLNNRAMLATLQITFSHYTLNHTFSICGVIAQHNLTNSLEHEKKEKLHFPHRRLSYFL